MADWPLVVVVLRQRSETFHGSLTRRYVQYSHRLEPFCDVFDRCLELSFCSVFNRGLKQLVCDVFIRGLKQLVCDVFIRGLKQLVCDVF